MIANAAGVLPKGQIRNVERALSCVCTWRAGTLVEAYVSLECISLNRGQGMNATQEYSFDGRLFDLYQTKFPCAATLSKRPYDRKVESFTGWRIGSEG